ncbi:DUF6093 family protein [Nakamurella aerolata]|uniref:Uncharacterized protein n=1 Tax=Nakamurella aerolata TaxID=1656892 RepID=A0A849AJF1_9ACTN|nr:DUF6093 family protein [Nakamurella aerolata]NNG36942.1 hypothetical protein [Nakamurella aerolata]
MLADDIDLALPELRAHTESLMQDTCVITVAGDGLPVWDEETQTSVPPEPQVIYEGKCRIRLPQMNSDRPLLAVDQVVTVQHIISIPVAAVDVPNGATVTVTASRWDAANVGRRFTVRSTVHQSQATAQRLACEEVQS